MNENIREKIDTIASNYFNSATVLFQTVTFFNVSIICAHDIKDERLATSYDELEISLLKYNLYDTERPMLIHTPSLCFSFLVSAFENYLIELLSLTLISFPYKISKETVDLKKVIELTKEELILYKAKEYINQIMYKSPKDYLRSLAIVLALNENDISTEFNQYIEIKARRDIGIHNNWKKNEIYERKARESGIELPCNDNLAPDLDYFRQSYETCGKLVEKITSQVCSNIFKVPTVFS